MGLRGLRGFTRRPPSATSVFPNESPSLSVGSPSLLCSSRRRVLLALFPKLSPAIRERSDFALDDALVISRGDALSVTHFGTWLHFPLLSSFVLLLLSEAEPFLSLLFRAKQNPIPFIKVVKLKS